MLHAVVFFRSWFCGNGIGPRTFFLPWKAPVLNLVDALSNGCFVALLSVALAFLEVDSDGAANLMQHTAIVLSTAMVARRQIVILPACLENLAMLGLKSVSCCRHFMHLHSIFSMQQSQRGFCQA